MKRILVVEDEPTILAAVATRLRAEEFQVETAVDGPSAVQAATANPPDPWYEFHLSRWRAPHDEARRGDECAMSGLDSVWRPGLT